MYIKYQDMLGFVWKIEILVFRLKFYPSFHDGSVLASLCARLLTYWMHAIGISLGYI